MQSQQNSIPPAAGGQSQQQNLNQIVSETLSTPSFTHQACRFQKAKAKAKALSVT
jgi:hypothetical protein